MPVSARLAKSAILETNGFRPLSTTETVTLRPTDKV